MEKPTILKFGKVLKEFSSNENLSGLVSEAYNELDDLKKKRIDKSIALCN
jgi:hypothetical protein